MPSWDRAAPWYHGSPEQLTILRTGSTITQNRDLARIFSHKPSLVCIEDDGRIQHSGSLPGYLYRVAEELAPEDVTPHPRSTMPDGQEWLITRPLRVELVCPTTPQEGELLSLEECRALRDRAAAFRDDIRGECSQ